MSGAPARSGARARYLVVHDETVSLERKGAFHAICHALTQAGADAHVFMADTADAAMTVACDTTACAGYRAVLTAGRTATFDALAVGLQSSGIPVAALPEGGVSRLARAAGFDGRPQAIANQVLSAVPAPLATLALNSSPIRACTTVGTDGAVLRTLTKALFPTLGQKAGGVGLATKLIKPVERFDVALDGMNYRCSSLLLVATNGPVAAVSGLNRAGPARGPVTAVMVEADDRISLSSVLMSAKVGRLLRNDAVHVRTAEFIEIPAGQALAWICDAQQLETDALPQRDAVISVDAYAPQVLFAPAVAEVLPSASPSVSAAAA